MQHLVRVSPGSREQELRDYLGGFDFRGAMADAPLTRFSGGEKSRLALALLVRKKPNLLLLDEPTNHLDLEMRHALTRALAEYEGTLVLVSHDRALLRAACDAFLLVHDRRAQEFDGDVDDYVSWLGRTREQNVAGVGDASGEPAPPTRKEARAAEAAERQTKLAQRRPLLRTVSDLERDLARWHDEQRKIDETLADPSLYEKPDPDELKRLAQRQGELTRLIDEAEHRWLEVQSELEAIGEV